MFFYLVLVISTSDADPCDNPANEDFQACSGMAQEGEEADQTLNLKGERRRTGQGKGQGAQGPKIGTNHKRKRDKDAFTLGDDDDDDSVRGKDKKGKQTDTSDNDSPDTAAKDGASEDEGGERSNALTMKQLKGNAKDMMKESFKGILNFGTPKSESDAKEQKKLWKQKNRRRAVKMAIKAGKERLKSMPGDIKDGVKAKYNAVKNKMKDKFKKKKEGEKEGDKNKEGEDEEKKKEGEDENKDGEKKGEDGNGDDDQIEEEDEENEHSKLDMEELAGVPIKRGKFIFFYSYSSIS